jgi:hypothetical protein
MRLSDNKMSLCAAVAVAALLVASGGTRSAGAQVVSGSDGPIACGDFQRGPNGVWTVLRPTTIRPEGVQMTLAPRQTFAKNQFVDGIEVTTVLDRNCGNQ